jgi:hypothetical protein
LSQRKFPGRGRSRQHSEVFRTILCATNVWGKSATGEPNVRLPSGRRLVQACKRPPKASRGSAVHPIVIETNGLDALVAAMAAWGDEFRNPVCDHGKFRCVKFAAPGEFLVEVIEWREFEWWWIRPWWRNAV